jgi:SAM-dependent methyltransferase
MEKKLCIQYGCGLSCPDGWINFDASPSLYISKIPIIGYFVRYKVVFPSKVKYGDILHGLPNINNESCDLIYCSHILEHLTLEDFRLALKNTFNLLKPGGVFRCVLPDLEIHINNYMFLKDTSPDASIRFLENTMLGSISKPKSWFKKLISFYGNSKHLWMWDRFSLESELRKIGFASVRFCKYADSLHPEFSLVEDEGRFREAISFECIK